ncbi:MAG: Rpn family recombination-promoting nuclease/putative transposase [Prevotella sp.]|nr:Rpn family recombination-promoting nuclease/putative transposase [Prevotella sp.]MDD7189277.1 Rpn family recombination-promoting nuclease/putative transposase [Prevotella sp.]MDY5314522.1 Rpn family recombination-promoting nuclease/putative transposase [Prevotella sp.]
MQENYIRFDWAMKRLLRDKANYVVLEGFLASLLGKRFKIHRFLESEGNQEDEEDKYNRVDILAESEDGELCIIEVQNSRELSYFHRMLYGVSKAITEYIGLGKPYEEVRKVYSINIVYFELGQGKDYVYHGKTEFVGLHQPHDTLKLSVRQNEKFFGNKEFDVMKRKAASDLFPEYYVLRVNDFDKVATTPLDEWIEFLKTGNISAKAKAAGLSEARERLRVDALSDKDRQAYYRHMESVRHMKSLFDTSRDEGYEEGMDKGLAKGMDMGLAKGLAKGRSERAKEIAKQLKAMGLTTEQIAQATGLTLDEI